MQDPYPTNSIEHVISKWFIAAVQQDNLKNLQRSKFLNIFYYATFIALLFIMVGEAIDGKTPIFLVVANILLAVACLALRYWIHQGHVEWGSLVFIVLVVIYIAVAIAFFRFVHSLPLAGYPLFVTGMDIVLSREESPVTLFTNILAFLTFILIGRSEFWTINSFTQLVLQLPIYSLGFIIASSIFFWGFVVWRIVAQTNRQITGLDASQVPIMITDGEGKIEFINSLYTHLTGYALEEIKARQAPFLCADQVQPEIHLNLWETIRLGQVWQGEFQNQTKNGEPFLALYSITPIVDESGKIIHLVIIVKNISDRKRMEAEREALNRTREFAMLYEITHDLGNFFEQSALFQAILERVMILLDLYAAAIYVFDSKSRTFTLASEIGPSLQFGSVMPAERWLAEASAKTYLESPLIVRVPIIHADQCLGMLVLRMMQSSRSISKKLNLNLLPLIATQLASAMHNLDMFDQVRSSHLRAQDMAKNVLVTQEKERRSIARELHDEFGQELTSVQLGLQNIERLGTDAQTQVRLNEIMQTVEQVMEQMRNLSRALRPAVLDDFGLVPALEWIVEQQVKRAGLGGEIIATPLATRLPEEIETVCFRVAQEAITNVLRHGHASRIIIQVGLNNGKLEMIIQDDGVGFDLTKAMHAVKQGKSLGLLSMSERVELVGGQMDIVTANGCGARIQVSIPLPADAQPVELGKENGGTD